MGHKSVKCRLITTKTFVSFSLLPFSGVYKRILQKSFLSQMKFNILVQHIQLLTVICLHIVPSKLLFLGFALWNLEMRLPEISNQMTTGKAVVLWSCLQNEIKQAGANRQQLYCLRLPGVGGTGEDGGPPHYLGGADLAAPKFPPNMQGEKAAGAGAEAAGKTVL